MDKCESTVQKKQQKQTYFFWISTARLMKLTFSEALKYQRHVTESVELELKHFGRKSLCNGFQRIQDTGRVLISSLLGWPLALILYLFERLFLNA